MNWLDFFLGFFSGIVFSGILVLWILSGIFNGGNWFKFH